MRKRFQRLDPRHDFRAQIRQQCLLGRLPQKVRAARPAGRKAGAQGGKFVCPAAARASSCEALAPPGSAPPALPFASAASPVFAVFLVALPMPELYQKAFRQRRPTEENKGGGQAMTPGVLLPPRAVASRNGFSRDGVRCFENLTCFEDLTCVETFSASRSETAPILAPFGAKNERAVPGQRPPVRNGAC